MSLSALAAGNPMVDASFDHDIDMFPADIPWCWHKSSDSLLLPVGDRTPKGGPNVRHEARALTSHLPTTLSCMNLSLRHNLSGGWLDEDG